MRLPEAQRPEPEPEGECGTIYLLPKKLVHDNRQSGLEIISRLSRDPAKQFFFSAISFNELGKLIVDWEGAVPRAARSQSQRAAWGPSPMASGHNRGGKAAGDGLNTHSAPTLPTAANATALSSSTCSQYSLSHSIHGHNPTTTSGKSRESAKRRARSLYRTGQTNSAGMGQQERDGLSLYSPPPVSRKDDGKLRLDMTDTA